MLNIVTSDNHVRILYNFVNHRYRSSKQSISRARGGPTSACHLECHLVEYVLFYIVIMEHVMKKQNGVKENFQVVYLQNRKVLEGIKLLFIFY